MNDDQLRARLAGLDPQAGSPVAPIPRALLEAAMTLTDEPMTTTAPRRRGWRAAAGAVALTGLAAGLTAVVVVNAHPDHEIKRPALVSTAPVGKATVLDLSLPAGGASSMSCLRFSVDILKDMPVAFAGTVTGDEGGTVQLQVTHWFHGGTAAFVTLGGSGTSGAVSEDGATFEKGKAYLVTATDGTVNGCGYTGPDTPDLRASFEQAWPG